jgi:hypothetical protein
MMSWRTGDGTFGDRPLQARRPGAHRRRGVEVSAPPRLPDAVYDEIADVLLAEAERMASSRSSPSSGTSLKAPKRTRRRSKE